MMTPLDTLFYCIEVRMMLKMVWIKIGLRSIIRKEKIYIVLHVDHLYVLIKHLVQHVAISFVPFVQPTY